MPELDKKKRSAPSTTSTGEAAGFFKDQMEKVASDPAMESDDVAKASRPSRPDDELMALLKEKVVLTYGETPKFIVNRMEERRTALGLKTKRAYLYHLLRLDGIDIPPDEKLDRRKR